MTIRTRRAVVLAAALAALLPLARAARAQAASDPLRDGFESPPPSALPRTWWHWTRSNITKTGITKDLEWMKRVGIGGAQIADVNSGGGQEVEDKIVFGTPEWYDAVRH
ncbi:MAG TPA: glycosyl hydrolase, partial [Longimicrobiaceae bacterium]|nr:glycosyl hydrolase [Longimicrobiaceae bacterium]